MYRSMKSLRLPLLLLLLSSLAFAQNKEDPVKEALIEETGGHNKFGSSSGTNDGMIGADYLQKLDALIAFHKGHFYLKRQK